MVRAAPVKVMVTGSNPVGRAITIMSFKSDSFDEDPLQKEEVGHLPLLFIFWW